MLDEFPLNPVLPAQDGTTIVVTEIRERVPPPYPTVSFLVTVAPRFAFESLPGSASLAELLGFTREASG